MLGALWWSGCGGECPNITQPEIETLSKWKKDRFPYSRLTKLKFIVADQSKIDTLLFERIKYDSIVMNSGDEYSVETNCRIPYDKRWNFYTTVFKNSKEDEILKFTHDSDRKRISVRWSQDSTRVIHDFLDGIYGYKNQKRPSDGVTLLNDLKYENVYCNEITGAGLQKYEQCYHFDFGFIYFYDKQIEKKWYLLDSE
jgi:hypothetical protein